MKITIFVIISFFVAVFLAGVVSAAFLGRKKNRRAHAKILIAQLPEELRQILVDIWSAHRDNNIERVNDIASNIGSDRLNPLLKFIGPENRPKVFSSGEFGDNLSWTALENALQDKGYTTNASKLITGIVLHELDTVFKKIDKNS